MNLDSMPVDRNPMGALAFLVDGYSFLPRRFERYRSDVFQTRLFGERIVCVRGPEATRLFYDTDRFERSSAMPGPIEKTVFGQGGVQGMDGAAHRQRKAMFMQLMTAEAIEDVAARTEQAWLAALPRWEQSGRISLFEEARTVLCEAACGWAGVPLSDGEARRRARDMLEAVDGFGTLGPRHWRARRGRQQSEKWIEGIVAAVRSGELSVDEGSALHTVATHREVDGEPLSDRIAAVEVLNVIRPFVAIAWFVTFMAMALHDHPEWKQRLRSGDEADAERFVHETRRFYPFVPMLGARTRRPFEWNGHQFDGGMLVLLDVFGVHRDGRLWENPGEFRPDRFLGWISDGYDFIPQGGGDHHRDHRCAGEWFTIAVMQAVAKLLAGAMDYQVPDHDTRLRLDRVPVMPKDGLIIAPTRRSVDDLSGRRGGHG